MKKLLSTLVCTLVLGATAAPVFAQTLADVAKKEEERRKAIRTPSKVITNTDLKPGQQPIGQGTPPAVDTSSADKDKNGDKSTDAVAAAQKEAADLTKTQKYWADRKKAMQTTLDRDTGYAEALQVRINALTADFVNRDDPVQKGKIEQDRIKALAELDRLKKAIDADKKALDGLDDEARKAGVPPGWVR